MKRFLSEYPWCRFLLGSIGLSVCLTAFNTWLLPFFKDPSGPDPSFDDLLKISLNYFGYWLSVWLSAAIMMNVLSRFNSTWEKRPVWIRNFLCLLSPSLIICASFFICPAFFLGLIPLREHLFFGTVFSLVFSVLTGIVGIIFGHIIALDKFVICK